MVIFVHMLAINFFLLYAQKIFLVPEARFLSLPDRFATIPTHGFGTVIISLTTRVKCVSNFCYRFKILLVSIYLSTLAIFLPVNNFHYS